MSSPDSMTRQLMRWLIVVAVLFWLAAAAVAAFVMHHEYQEVFDSSLQEMTQRLVPLVVDDLYRRGAASAPRRMDELIQEHKEHLIYQVRDASGQVLLHSHDAPQDAFDIPLKSGFYQTATHRVYTEAALSGTLFVQVADPLDHRTEAMTESALSLVLPVLPLAPLSLIVIWLVVRRSLKPISTLKREIGSRDGANLSSINIENLPKELATIAGSVNHLLSRLSHALKAEREFTANAAHELRTPVAGALAQAQRLSLELPIGKAQGRARDIEQSLARLARLTEKLLQLARAEAGIGTTREPSDLAAIVRLVVAEFERSPAYSKRIQLEMDPSARWIRNVDVDAFGIVLRNLIENALVHGATDGTVTISHRNQDTIAISNSGETVPPEQLEKLTARFKRGAGEPRGQDWGYLLRRLWQNRWVRSCACNRLQAKDMTASRRF
ncbi:HAMP domain-containing sensor histidine kinase [Aminobacter sp. BA135]|uniref:sensor histidine kinase n=1 Tax=Aminobacter sp. BA135 TaxID=537596 RepID=UPI003D796177